MKLIHNLLSAFMMLTLLFPLGIMNVEAADDVQSHTPFVALSIPGEVAACDFDNGGNNVAYGTTRKTNGGSSKYRADEVMTIYENSMGRVLSFNVGEWTKHTVNVEMDGTYDMVIRYSVPGWGAVIKISMDGELLISLELDATGGYLTPCTKLIGVANLKKGTHVLKYEMISGGITFDKVTFFKSVNNKVSNFGKSGGAYKNIYLPALINAENFDIGIQGSHRITRQRDESVYRYNEGIKINKFGINDYSILLRNHEWVKYTFHVLNDGVFYLKLKSRASGSVDILFDNIENSISSIIKRDQVKHIGNVYLKQGEHSVIVKSTGTNIDLDTLEFGLTNGEYITLEGLANGSYYTKTEVSKEEQIKNYRSFYVSVNGDDTWAGGFDSPFKTIERAQEEVRRCNNEMKGDIVVNIFPGQYQLDKRLELGLADGGKNGYNVIYKGYNAFEAPVISGGIPVTGWTEMESGIWKANVQNVDVVRQLYVGGQMAQRARSKYLYTVSSLFDDPSTEYKADGFKVSAINFPEFTRAEDAELVFNILWTNQRVPVLKVEKEGQEKKIFMDQPYFYWSQTKSFAGTNPSPGSSFYIENAMEFLNDPGEFYFDRGSKTIYYKPYENENMKNIETYIGKTEFMVFAKGNSLEERISNIVFDNLDFRYGSWTQASETGVCVFQSDCIIEGPNSTSASGRTLPAQIQIEYAENISVKNCKFINLGSSAVSMTEGVINSSVVGNLMKDISGSGIVIGNWRLNMGDPVEKTCQNIDVKNNVIRRSGLEFSGSVGVGVYYSNFINVIHNDIRDIPYTGITIGWGWETNKLECSNNNIANNRIENISMVVRDGGHIYSLGKMYNLLIQENYIKKSQDFGGIYFDSGSGGATVKNNVAEDCQNWFFAVYPDYWDLVATNNYSNSKSWDNRTLPERSSIEQATIFPDANWSGEALGIINNSGVERKYKRLLSSVEAPEWRPYNLLTTPIKFYNSPNIIEQWAKDYMAGGEGVGYHKLAEGTVPKLFKQGTKYVVGNTNVGEWLKYEVDIKHGGMHKFELNYASNWEKNAVTPRVNVYLDDKIIFEGVELPSTGSWSVHAPINLGEFYVEKGKRIFKVEFVDNAFSFQSFSLKNEDSNKTDPEFDDGKNL